MEALSSRGGISNGDLIKYAITGINVTSYNKVVLYGCNELKVAIYRQIGSSRNERRKESHTFSPPQQTTKVEDVFSVTIPLFSKRIARLVQNVSHATNGNICTSPNVPKNTRNQPK